MRKLLSFRPNTLEGQWPVVVGQRQSTSGQKVRERVLSSHATEVTHGTWVAQRLFGQAWPRGHEVTEKAQANSHDPGLAQSPAGWGKKPEEMAFSAGIVVCRVGAYAQLQFKGSFLGDKIHTGCKGMLAATHIYSLLLCAFNKHLSLYAINRVVYQRQ